MQHHLLSFVYHEAVDSDRAALAEFRRVLRPGGRLLIQVPAYDWLRSRHDREVATRERYTAGELAHHGPVLRSQRSFEPAHRRAAEGIERRTPQHLAGGEELEPRLRGGRETAGRSARRRRSRDATAARSDAAAAT